MFYVQSKYHARKKRETERDPLLVSFTLMTFSEFKRSLIRHLLLLLFSLLAYIADCILKFVMLKLIEVYCFLNVLCNHISFMLDA